LNPYGRRSIDLPRTKRKVPAIGQEQKKKKIRPRLGKRDKEGLKITEKVSKSSICAKKKGRKRSQMTNRGGSSKTLGGGDRWKHVLKGERLGITVHSFN